MANDPKNSLSHCDQFTFLLTPDGTICDAENLEAPCFVCDRTLKEHPDAGIRALPQEKIDELRERAIVVSIAEEIAAREL